MVLLAIIVAIVIMFFGFFYDRILGVTKIIKQEKMAECSMMLSNFDSHIVGCEYELFLNSNTVKRLVRLGSIEKYKNNLYLNIYQRRNGKWEQERIFMGRENSEHKFGLKITAIKMVEIQGLEVNSKIVDVDEITEMLKKKINQEAVVFLRMNKNLFFKRYNHALLSLVLYEI